MGKTSGGARGEVGSMKLFVRIAGLVVSAAMLAGCSFAGPGQPPSQAPVAQPMPIPPPTVNSKLYLDAYIWVTTKAYIPESMPSASSWCARKLKAGQHRLNGGPAHIPKRTSRIKRVVSWLAGCIEGYDTATTAQPVTSRGAAVVCLSAQCYLISIQSYPG